MAAGAGGLEAVFAVVTWWRQREDVETVLCSPFSGKDEPASMVDDVVVLLSPCLHADLVVTELRCRWRLKIRMDDVVVVEKMAELCFHGGESAS